VSVSDRLDTATVMLSLAAVVIVLLLGVGLLRLYLSGDSGPLLRNIAIGVILLVFSVALYRQWGREGEAETE
jgi:hypothetical protein